ncbi:hypothetical protein [Rahnella aceris]|uniref:hypothetical protein n=1 Tax=Rahnella sp. (strain Y9602) TaxID=2703885 RepID=UPI001C25C286|nr:hypothetical protein [Rahnella aceris]MBU9866783.1 hypothetical protein [Rahnella aceris]
MTNVKNGITKPVYTFVQTEVASRDTYEEITLHVDGQPSRVLIMVCGKKEFCVCVDNIGNAENPHVKHVGIELTLAAAEKLAVSEYEILVSGK